jgi:hypothetical protein
VQCTLHYSHQQQGNKKQAAGIFHRSANLWGLSGEVTKTGEFLMKAAKEVGKQRYSVDNQLSSLYYLNPIP